MAEKKKGTPNNFSNMTPEQRAECGRRGGIASGEAKRRKKQAKTVMEVFLTMPLKKGKVADIEAIKSFMDLKGKNITVEEAMHLQLMQKALKGDLNAINMVLALVGEKPSEKVNIDAKVTKNPLEDLSSDELRELIKNNDTN